MAVWDHHWLATLCGTLPRQVDVGQGQVYLVVGMGAIRQTSVVFLGPLDTVRTLSVGVSQMTKAQAAGCDTHTPLYIFIFQ